MTRQIAQTLFVLASLGEVVSRLSALPLLHWICKPLIIVTLALYYYVGKGRSRWVLLAMLFAWLGDMALMFEASMPQFFIIGLLAFLAAHVFYIIAYRHHQVPPAADALHGIQKIRLAFPVILAGTGLVVVLYPALGGLKVPVLIYATVLVLMVLRGLFRYGHTTRRSFWLVFTGALLFMISDSILALDKFLLSIPFAGALIMATYALAQYGLVSGLLSHAESVRQGRN
jgi:uncharacterized membrane protein YhhN